MTETTIRKNAVSTARSFLGAKQGSSLHKKIIETYNSQKELPRKYRMTTADSWCAASVTAWAMLAGTYEVTPAECSCGEMITIAKRMGIWQERDDYVPKAGDLCLYDWDDSGKGDCIGAPEHIGMVASVGTRKFTVIEGNMGTSHVCGERSMSVNGRYIRGFICPRYGDLVVWENPSVYIPTLERGDTGGYVRVLQQLMNLRGAALEIDGSFGPATESEVRKCNGSVIADKDLWELLLEKNEL